MVNNAKTECAEKTLGRVLRGIFTLALFAFSAVDIFAAPMAVRFVTFNVDFQIPASKVRADVEKVEPKADVIMFQEAKNVTIDNFLGADWKVVQIIDQGDARRGSAIAFRTSLITQMLASGLRFGVGRNGEDMLDRYIAWADLKLINGLTIRVMSLHMPPARISYLQPVMADNLAGFVDETTYPVVVGGDWNFTVNNDPLKIEQMTGLVPRGVGIDGFYYSDEVVDVDAIFELRGLNVNSDHDPVQIVTQIDFADDQSSVADWALYN